MVQAIDIVELLEGVKWYQFKDTVTLFHGTASALRAQIQKQGLQPPKKDFAELVDREVEQYLKPFCSVKTRQEVKKKVLSSIQSLRTDTDFHELSSVIYLSTDRDDALGYAKQYAELGGEIHSDIFRFCSQEYKDLKPRFAGSKPLVVTVEVPSSWMLTYSKPKEMYRRGVKNWKSLKDWYKRNRGRDISLSQYLEEEGGFEVRINRTIPPKMILGMS